MLQTLSRPLLKAGKNARLRRRSIWNGEPEVRNLKDESSVQSKDEAEYLASRSETPENANGELVYLSRRRAGPLRDFDANLSQLVAEAISDVGEAHAQAMIAFSVE
jgi:hypothetical protein